MRKYLSFKNQHPLKKCKWKKSKNQIQYQEQDSICKKLWNKDYKIKQTIKITLNTCKNYNMNIIRESSNINLKLNDLINMIKGKKQNYWNKIKIKNVSLVYLNLKCQDLLNPKKKRPWNQN